MAGAAPTTVAEVNLVVGGLCRQFVLLQAQVNRTQAALAALDLTAAPFSLTSQQSADVKTPLSDLNTGLNAISRTFIDRVTGFF